MYVCMHTFMHVGLCMYVAVQYGDQTPITGHNYYHRLQTKPSLQLQRTRGVYMLGFLHIQFPPPVLPAVRRFDKMVK